MKGVINTMKNNKSNQHYSVRRISAFKVFGVAFACIFAILTFEFLGLIAVTLWDAILATAEQHFNTVFTFSKVFITSAITLLVAGFVVLINRIAVIEAENRRKREQEEWEFQQEQKRYAQQRAQQSVPRYQQRERPFDQDAQPRAKQTTAPQQRSANPERKEEIYVLPAANIQRRAQ